MSSRFTVGDDEEIKKLEALICGQGPHLIEAEAGYGKSHLLEHVREKALDQQFLVSLTRLDSTGEVRFNRFDQIVGAIFRNLEAPQTRAGKGVEPFMNTLCDAIQQSRFKGLSDFWVKLTNDSKWDGDIHGLIESPALYIALRAWFFGGDLQRRLVEDWLGHPWRYDKDRKGLVRNLIEDLRSHFIDPRPPSALFSNKDRIFHFKEPEYIQSWAVLRDINKLAKAVGYKGLVLLFDDMDDISRNLGNLKFLKLALANLFRFLEPEFFGGKSFFAVDIDFEKKCRHEFIKKRQSDYDLHQFNEISRFRMNALPEEDLMILADKIVEAHCEAHGWGDDADNVQQEVKSIAQAAAKSMNEHRPREVVRSVLEHLDMKLEGSE